MQNIEALTYEEEGTVPSAGSLYCYGDTIWGYVGIETGSSATREHWSNTDSLDVIEEFNMSRCAAAGIGNKRGNNSDTDINPKSGVKYVPCDPNAHYTFDDMMYDFLN